MQQKLWREESPYTLTILTLLALNKTRLEMLNTNPG